MIKVMVTGAGALLGQGIIKCLRIAQTQYHIIAVDPDPRSVGLYWADQAHLVPLANNPSYMETIFSLLETERPNVLLVGTDVELIHFAKYKHHIQEKYGVHVIVNSPEVIQIANDKWDTYQFLTSRGFPHPASALPKNAELLSEQNGFPLIVKPRNGARSIGVHRVENKEQLFQAMSIVDDPIIQECVSSPEDEYTSGIVIADNSIKAVVTMCRDLRDGNTYRAYTQPDADCNPLLIQIATELNAEGSINFQFRMDQGVPKIFEINARFSGTTPLRAYSGFNEVDALIRYYVYREEIEQPQISPSIVLRYWNEIIISPDALELLKTKGELLTPLFESPFQLL